MHRWRRRQRSLYLMMIYDSRAGKQDDGRRLIDQAHQRLGQYKYAYALLTHNATTDESESDLEKIIARDYPAIADHVVVIAKTRLTGEDRERFRASIKGDAIISFVSRAEKQAERRGVRGAQ